jgi:aspartyl protease family protein
MLRHHWRRLAAAALLLLPSSAVATDVVVVGVTPGRSADLVIEQREPITVEEGQTIDGVTVVSVTTTGAVVRIDGVTRTLALTAVRGAGAAAASSITLAADARGHYLGSGTINGRPVRFIVDTGATYVALSRADATRLGIDYAKGTPAMSSTANGVVRGWIVSLASVRVGEVAVRDVAAMVVDGDVPGVLLGMSFLERFDMRQTGSTLVLRRNRR